MPSFLQIGLFLGLNYEYNRQVLRGLVSYARPNKPWVLHFINTAGTGFKVEDCKQFDAFFGNLSKKSTTDLLAPLKKPMMNISHLMVNRDLPRVGIDDVGLGRTAARHFIERGFRNFAFTGYNRHGYSAAREEGFAAELAAHGLTYASHAAYATAHGVPEYEPDRFDSLRDWIRTLPRPIAIMGANDSRAWDVLEACREAGIPVPEDVAVLGADNDPAVCMTAFPSLSSIAVPGDRIGYEAAVLLDAMLRGEKVGLEPLLIPDKGAVTRQSSDILAIPDPELAAAVRYIRENASNRIGVNDIVRAVPVARRSLERKFRALLRRSPLEEIRRVRLERVRSLLANTDLSMPAIAARCGFESAVRLTTVFREETNMTPTEYRRQFRMREQGEIDEEDPRPRPETPSTPRKRGRPRRAVA